MVGEGANLLFNRARRVGEVPTVGAAMGRRLAAGCRGPALLQKTTSVVVVQSSRYQGLQALGGPTHAEPERVVAKPLAWQAIRLPPRSGPPGLVTFASPAARERRRWLPNLTAPTHPLASCLAPARGASHRLLGLNGELRRPGGAPPAPTAAAALPPSCPCRRRALPLPPCHRCLPPACRLPAPSPRAVDARGAPHGAASSGAAAVAAPSPWALPA